MSNSTYKGKIKTAEEKMQAAQQASRFFQLTEEQSSAFMEWSKAMCDPHHNEPVIEALNALLALFPIEKRLIILEIVQEQARAMEEEIKIEIESHHVTGRLPEGSVDSRAVLWRTLSMTDLKK